MKFYINRISFPVKPKLTRTKSSISISLHFLDFSQSLEGDLTSVSCGTNPSCPSHFRAATLFLGVILETWGRGKIHVTSPGEIQTPHFSWCDVAYLIPIFDFPSFVEIEIQTQVNFG